MATGTVKWFNDTKGYGFIAQDDGPDVFVHQTAIEMSGHRTLTENQKVEFDIQQGPKGPQASNVRGIWDRNVEPERPRPDAHPRFWRVASTVGGAARFCLSSRARRDGVNIAPQNRMCVYG